MVASSTSEVTTLRRYTNLFIIIIIIIPPICVGYILRRLAGKCANNRFVSRRRVGYYTAGRGLCGHSDLCSRSLIGL